MSKTRDIPDPAPSAAPPAEADLLDALAVARREAEALRAERDAVIRLCFLIDMDQRWCFVGNFGPVPYVSMVSACSDAEAVGVIRRAAGLPPDGRPAEDAGGDRVGPEAGRELARLVLESWADASLAERCPAESIPATDALRFAALRVLGRPIGGRDDDASSPSACMDCGLDYDGFAGDLVLSHDQWSLIHPTPEGMLCPTCLCARARKLGAACVLAYFELPGESRPDDEEGRVLIDYTNYRGERSARVVKPRGFLRWGSNEWHPEPQWLIDAYDPAKGEDRTFAVKDIHCWTPAGERDGGETPGERGADAEGARLIADEAAGIACAQEAADRIARLVVDLREQYEAWQRGAEAPGIASSNDDVRIFFRLEGPPLFPSVSDPLRSEAIPVLVASIIRRAFGLPNAPPSPDDRPETPESPQDATEPAPPDPGESGPADRTTGLPGGLAGALRGPASPRACPWCGPGADTDLTREDGTDRLYRECLACGATGPKVATLDEALADAAWDRRAEAEAAPGDAPAARAIDAGAVERAARSLHDRSNHEIEYCNRLVAGIIRDYLGLAPAAGRGGDAKGGGA